MRPISILENTNRRSGRRYLTIVNTAASEAANLTHEMNELPGRTGHVPRYLGAESQDYMEK